MNQPYCFSLIVAMTPDQVIGLNNTLPWHLPSDMASFKRITMGHPVIMGRKNWESIPEKFRPLQGRTNIVITHQADYMANGAMVVSSIEDACTAASHAPGTDEIFVIGGAEIYQQFIERVQKAYVTIVCAHIQGDVHLMEKFEPPNWHRESPVTSISMAQDAKDEYPKSFCVFRRING
jgi:dihydrofolate reductase